MLIQLSDSEPIYQQIYDAFKTAILSGELQAGQKVPSSRHQAEQLSVSRNSVLFAYEQLIAEGYLSTKLGGGTFVSADIADQVIAAPQGSPPNSALLPISNYAERALALKPGSPLFQEGNPEFNFRYGLSPLDEQLQKEWKRHIAKAAQNLPINYADTAGNVNLRSALKDYLKTHRGVTCKAENILITSGSQQAIYLAAQVLLERNDTVLIENPCYQGAKHILKAHPATLNYSNVDSEGMLVPEQEAKLAYITPSHQFPTGAVMSVQRRLELLNWAKTHEAFILEDDYDSEYRYEGKPIAAIQSLDTEGRVIYVGTFSKTLFPALRLGFMVLPDSLVEPFQAVKWLSDRHNSSLEQLALASFISEGQFERHVRRTRTQNAKNRELLLEALDDVFGNEVEVMGSNAGIHLVAWFKNHSTEHAGEIIAAALKKSVGIYPISPYYEHPPETLGVLLGYAALESSRIREGIGRLREVL